MNTERTLRLVVSASVVIFFIQALRVVFSVLFGIIYDQVFEGPTTAWLAISVLLVLAALAAPAVLPSGRSARSLALWAVAAGLARLLLCANNADLRYWGSLGVLLAGGAYLAGVIGRDARSTFASLVAALAADQVLRALGQTYDLSLRGAWLPLQALWALAVIAAAWRIRDEANQPGPAGGLTPSGAIALGSVFFLEMSLLTLPNAAARWGGVPYLWTAPLLLAATLGAGLAAGSAAGQGPARHAAPTIAAGLVLLVCLPLGYFVPGPISLLALVLAQLAAVFRLRGIVCGGAGEGGRSLAVGWLVFVVLNFLNAFAFTYPYTLPAMRGMGWLVYLGAAALSALGWWERPPQSNWEPSPGRAPALILAVAALLATTAAAWPVAADPLPQSGDLRLATYNIHYGYDDVWHLTLEDQARLIEENGVDVIALQEVDTGRLTSYGIDNAHYLARRLRMNAAYLPTVEHLTGIAILYRGPAVEADTALIPSLQEQTGIVRVDLDLGGMQLSAHGIWMGLSSEDTSAQIDAALDFIGSRTPASFGGDFNAEDGEPVPQAVLRAGFVDPFTSLGILPVPPTDPAVEPEKRIDFVWLRGLHPLRAWVPASTASDHRLVVVEVATTP